MNYGERLKELRESFNISQIKIANVLNISQPTYNHYEIQYNDIPIKHVITLCEYFNISVDYFLGLTDIKSYSINYKKIDFKNAGNRLKEFRKDNKLTQKKLASILNTTFSSIAWNEKGRNLISTPFLYSICSKYNISADYLLGRIDSPKYFK